MQVAVADPSPLIKIRPCPANVQISQGRTVFVCDQDGNARRDHASEGLYVYQTRVLSRYAWSMNGKPSEFSCGSNVEQFSWIGYYIQAPANCKETPSGECDPLQQTIELRLNRSVGEGLHEDVRLTNHTQIATSVRLELEFEHELVSRKEVAQGRQQHGRLESRWSEPEPGVWELRSDYRARHRYAH
jgi:hypothetical protein